MPQDSLPLLILLDSVSMLVGDPGKLGGYPLPVLLLHVPGTTCPVEMPGGFYALIHCVITINQYINIQYCIYTFHFSWDDYEKETLTVQ